MQIIDARCGMPVVLDDHVAGLDAGRRGGHCRRQAGGDERRRRGRHRFGSGPVIQRGSTLDPVAFELLHETAEAEDIPFTVTASARSTGTDADAIHNAGTGVPTALLSIPNRYMHSPVEMVALDDLDRAADVIAEACRAVAAETDFTDR